MNCIVRVIFSVVVVVAITGCMNNKGKINKDYDFANRRAPSHNSVDHNYKTERIRNFEQNSYYAFNEHNEKLAYYNAPPKEVFLNGQNKKQKKPKKKVKIYKKVPTISNKKPAENNLAPAKEGIVHKKSTPKIEKKGGMVKIVPRKNDASVARDSRPTSARKLIPMQNDKKPKMDIVELPDIRRGPSKLEIEKDVAYLRQDHITKNHPDPTKNDNKVNKNDSKKMDLITKHEAVVQTHDPENRPIPLPFN